MNKLNYFSFEINLIKMRAFQKSYKTLMKENEVDMKNKEFMLTDQKN